MNRRTQTSTGSHMSTGAAAPDRSVSEIQSPRVGGNIDRSQTTGVDHDVPAAVSEPDADNRPHSILAARPVLSSSGSGAVNDAITNRASLPDPAAFIKLRILSETYYDLQQSRIRTSNRIGAAIRLGVVDPTAFVSELAQVEAVEHQVELSMVREYRTVAKTILPGVLAWQKREKGIGEKLLARLLGHLGHPRYAFPHRWMTDNIPESHECGATCGSGRHLVAETPFVRTPAQLRSYCGFGDPSRKRWRGMSAEDATALGNPQCKTLVWLLAQAAMKRRLPNLVPESNGRAVGDLGTDQTPGDSQNAGVGAELSSQSKLDTESERAAAGAALDHYGREYRNIDVEGYSYRVLYEQRRAQTRDREDWTPGHQQADALRIVAKAILNDLWEASA